MPTRPTRSVGDNLQIQIQVQMQIQMQIQIQIQIQIKKIQIQVRMHIYRMAWVQCDPGLVVDGSLRRMVDAGGWQADH